MRVHPMLVFFAVITGGELFGIPGVAELRVLYDFLRVRVRVVDESPASRELTGEPRDGGRNRVAIVPWDTVPATSS